MFRQTYTFLLVALVCALPASTAHAHRYELGISLEPAIIALPAVADQASKNTLAPAAGGGIALEYYALEPLAIVVRGGYVQAFGDSLIGEATFSNRTGNYYFQQSAGYALAGLRLETPSLWLPVSFFVSGLGGVAVLSQTQRQLLEEGTGRDFGLGLGDMVRPMPMITASIGISGRVTNQIRLNAEPAAFIFPLKPVVVGVGATIGITFLFYP